MSTSGSRGEALVAVAKTYLDGGRNGDGSTADHYQVVVHADAKSLTGGTGRADFGETVPDNMTLLCTYHRRLLHEGGFGIVRNADATLRFVTADGCTIPRGGYRLEDFVDDDVGSDTEQAATTPHERVFAPRSSGHVVN